MRYVSTRGEAPPATLSEAVERGIAPDGGLYVPETFPAVPPEELGDADSLASAAERLLAPFFAGDALADELGAICREAFTFPVPLKELRDQTAVLELFHGPTAAFNARSPSSSPRRGTQGARWRRRSTGGRA